MNAAHCRTLAALVVACLGMGLPGLAQDAARPAAIVLAPAAMPIDGSFAGWEAIEAEQRIRDDAGEVAATFKLAFDETYLYAFFRVADDSPMRNQSAVREELLKGGDAVGLCLGPVGGMGGNQRILAAQIDGQPVLMAYRPQWPDKRLHTFSSPVGDLGMDYVGPVEGARVAFVVETDGYGVEIALPWSGLGLRGDFSGLVPFDVQVIYSDPAGTLNVDTVWWHATGGGAYTTEDLPTEAALYPDTWGAARLYERAPGPRIVHREETAAVGLPITFELPRSARVSLIVVDDEGWIVRELLRAEPMDAGAHTVHWDGRDRYDEALPPGDYTWRLAYFDGMGSAFHGSVGNSARPPFRTADGKGSKGGQHGGPSVIAADAGGVYILGGAEEGHPAMRKIDRDGHTLWKRSMGGFGQGVAAAVDANHVYILQRTRQGVHVVRLDPETGSEAPFPGGAVRVGDAGMQFGGLAIVGNRAYFSVPAENRIGRVQLDDGTVDDAFTIERPLGLARFDDNRLLVCSGDAIHRLDTTSGDLETVIADLAAPRALAMDEQGRFYVSDLGDSQQIKIFQDTRQVGAIGVPGGRPDTVLNYDPRALRNVVGLAIDAENHVWAVEQSPLRRVARFDRDGGHVLDLYGPVAYNVFGPDLDDFSTVYYQTSQGSPVYAKAIVDYDAYRAAPVQGGTEAWRIQAIFHLAQDADEAAGEVDLMTAPMAPGYGHVVAFTANHGHRYLWRIAKSNRASNPAGAAIWRWTDQGWQPAAFISNQANRKSWSDANGDGRVQPEELYDPPPTRHFAWLDRDLVLYGWHGALAPARVDERGVPFYEGGDYTPYLAPEHEPIKGGWVFNSMPDDEGAIYYAGNIGPHRHAAGSWDRACENPLIKVKNGRVQWVIGQHEARAINEGDMNTVTGIAGVVDDILIAHIVEPPRYIAFTTDGFTLGNVIVDETGRQPRVGPNAIYIESFTGLFLRDPDSGKRLLFAVSSGDDRILEVTGPGEITRIEGPLPLASSFPRVPDPLGQAVIPYETWWGRNARGYGINARGWQWLPHSSGLAIYEDDVVVGHVRLRRDAGALHVLADVLAPGYRQPEDTPQNPGDLWGHSNGLELMIGPARPLAGREPMPGDTRLFLTVVPGGAVALAQRTDVPGWQPIPGAHVAMHPRWNGYGWRLEAKIPFDVLPEVTRRRLQVFRRGVQIETFQEERLDLAGPVRLNAAFHIYDGDARRVPWLDDATDLAAPERMRPDRWGYANAMVDMSWPESPYATTFAVYRSSVDEPHAVDRVAEAVPGTRYIDAPEPGDYLYWLAPITREGEGRPVGPVAARESTAAFPPVAEQPASPFAAIDDMVVLKPHNTGLISLALAAETLAATAPPGVVARTGRHGTDRWTVAVTVPEESNPGEVFPIRLVSTGAEGGTTESTFDAVVGVDLMANLPPGSMPPGEDEAPGWHREPPHDAEGSPTHVVRVTEADGKPAPSIELRAWNSDNHISYRLNARPATDYWEASGHIRVVARAGNTSIGVAVLDTRGQPIADLHFGRTRFDDGFSSYISLLGESVARTEADYRMAYAWQPFTIRAEKGVLRVTYGDGMRRHTVEETLPETAAWNEPGAVQIYLGGRTSGRHARVDNLLFFSK